MKYNDGIRYKQHNKTISLLEQYQIIEESVKKQEIWRQKQIDIFYKQGRPIFDITIVKYRFFHK
jgi:general stress protein 26